MLESSWLRQRCCASVAATSVMHFDDVALDSSRTPSDTAGLRHVLNEPRNADYSNLRGALQAEAEPSHQPDDHLVAAGSNPHSSGGPSSPYQMQHASPGAAAEHQTAVAPHAAAEAAAALDEETMHIKDLDSGREYTLDKVRAHRVRPASHGHLPSCCRQLTVMWLHDSEDVTCVQGACMGNHQLECVSPGSDDGL